MSDRRILNTLEADEILRCVHDALFVDRLSVDRVRLIKVWKQLADYVMLSVEYIPDLMLSVEASMANQYLLWYPEENQTVRDLISCAKTEFVRRFGKGPAIVMINPQTADKAGLYVYDAIFYGIDVHITNSILPDRIWLGSRIE